MSEKCPLWRRLREEILVFSQLIRDQWGPYVDIVVLTLFRGVYNIIERHEQIIFLLNYAN
jgi:hypothetical protein